MHPEIPPHGLVFRCGYLVVILPFSRRVVSDILFTYALAVTAIFFWTRRTMLLKGIAEEGGDVPLSFLFVRSYTIFFFSRGATNSYTDIARNPILGKSRPPSPYAPPDTRSPTAYDTAYQVHTVPQQHLLPL